jgi:mannosyltransferase OCH1-like enzyme
MEGPIGEDAALKANVQHTISLHADAKVLFLTDNDCLASIARVMGPDSPLLDFFRKESHGMYKADICRGAALYEHGGLYMDVDMHARMSLWSAIKPTSTFVVPLSSRLETPGKLLSSIYRFRPE